MKTENRVQVRQMFQDAVDKDHIKHNLVNAAKQDQTQILTQYQSSLQGISHLQADMHRRQFGDNTITHAKQQSLLRRVLLAFINPFTAILLVLAAVSAITDIALPLMNQQAEDVSIITVVIIITMVMLSGTLRFVQESRSGNAASKLLAMITTTTCVERLDDGKQERPLQEVVVGDIIHLTAGDMIPADVRLLQAKDLFVSQSSLTGESEPAEKMADVNAHPSESFLDNHNLAFMGSYVVSGTAMALVIAVGNQTLFGSIAKSMVLAPTATSFEKGVNSVSWVLIRFMLVMVPIVFFINGITKDDWLDAFLFAISVAVGLTPEMLPMIVTTCLAKGAVAMSKQKTIIKNLNAIQNFGAMDVLCTDKTGTLTQDKVVLQRHLDVEGKTNLRVLQYGFLNSHYQTGLKNLMDVSIIDHTHALARTESILQNLATHYQKLDEIPFDFKRRRMSVVVAEKNGLAQLITKGAIEEMLSICAFVECDHQVSELSAKKKGKILKAVTKLNEEGMRVIAIARKDQPVTNNCSVADENQMILMGYLAFLDPPKDSAAVAIRTLKEYGVTTKILTGDNDKVTLTVCNQVGMDDKNVLLGAEINRMSDADLKVAIENTHVFAKLTPDQKARIVRLLRENGHTVGYMGDGINDAPAMKAADVGVSVDTAVDIAKETADIILLEKDLMVLERGIIEGRKTYANMIKYIKMTASSNFGNMFSVLVASAFIPFLPMMSIHLILLNLIYDVSCIALPWDNVDEEFLKTPRQWDASSIGKFMLWIGPTSSVFDITTYLLMYFVICPAFVSDGVLFNAIPEEDVVTRLAYIALFQTGWFVESMWTQTFVIHMIRTPKIPFIQSRASLPVFVLTFTGIGLLTLIPFTPLGDMIGLASLPAEYFVWLVLTVLAYMGLVTVLKKQYLKRYGELL